MAARPGVAVRMLTSGTTGPPKRIDLTYDMLAHSVIGPEPDRVAGADGTAPRRRDRQRPAGAHRRGVPGAAMRRRGKAVRAAGPIRARQWADAVRRHRPRAVSLVPAALRMVLHSDSDAARTSTSIRAVTSGTAPLSADDADAFSEKFGIPVLTSYAATEFGGGVAGWTLADHQKYWQAKRGSVGRANPGAQLRVVDDDGTPARARTSPGCSRSNRVSSGRRRTGCAPPTWRASTTTASCGSSGRADQAIIRGGFKVMPDDVRAALESHPAVRGRGRGRQARRPPRRDARRRGGAAGCRVDRRRRTGRVPANPAGALRDSHRDRDRRRDPPDTVRQARSERHPWPAEPRHRRRDVLRRQAADSRGTHPLLVCDADRLSYAEAERRSAAARPRPGRPRRGQGHPRRPALPERRGVRRRDAGRGADRRRGRPVHRPSPPRREIAAQLAHSDIEILLATASLPRQRLPARGWPTSTDAVPAAAPCR